MKALSRCREPGWFDKRSLSFMFTFLAYFVVCSVAFLGYTVYKMLPPLDWDEILKISAGAFFFCVNWYFMDDVLWS
jgi:hypothetical protein